MKLSVDLSESVLYCQARLVDENGKLIARVVGGRGKHQTNAEFICRAVNAHADLVAALEACLSLANALAAYYSIQEKQNYNHPDHEMVLDIGHAALAKAKGE